MCVCVCVWGDGIAEPSERQGRQIRRVGFALSLCLSVCLLSVDTRKDFDIVINRHVTHDISRSLKFNFSATVNISCQECCVVISSSNFDL